MSLAHLRTYLPNLRPSKVQVVLNVLLHKTLELNEDMLSFTYDCVVYVHQRSLLLHTSAAQTVTVARVIEKIMIYISFFLFLQRKFALKDM